MTEKENEKMDGPANFKRAYLRLKLLEAPIVKEAIMKRCWWSSQTFSHKKDGKRGLTLKETEIVEITFRAFGLDAWTGEDVL
jgi:hypothetical protein